MNRTRLTLMLIAVVVLSVIGGVIISRTVITVWESFDNATSANVPALLSLSDIKADAIALQSEAATYALALDEMTHSADDHLPAEAETAVDFDLDDQLNEINKSADQVWLALEVYQETSASPDAADYAEQIKQKLLALNASVNDLAEIKAAGVTGPDVLVILQDFAELEQELNTAIDAALEYETAQLALAEETIVKNIRTAPIIVGTLAVFTLLLTNGFGIALNRQYRGQAAAQARIAEQNRALSKAVREIAAAKRQADEANRLKSEFLATMSHELRTPMNAILGFTQVMLAGMSGEIDEDARRMLTRIKANGDRLLALINDVLDLAKIEAKRIDIIDRPFDPRKLVTGLVEQVANLAEEKGLVLDLLIDDKLPQQLIGDDGQISKIVTNLLSNAIKFTEKGRVDVRLRANQAGSTWEIAVTDTGIGIPPHALEFIFDPFRQVDGSTQRAYQGTGLGLAIVQELARAMGGTVIVQSAVGKGATFTVTLPLLTTTAEKVIF